MPNEYTEALEKAIETLKKERPGVLDELRY